MLFKTRTLFKTQMLLETRMLEGGGGAQQP